MLKNLFTKLQALHPFTALNLSGDIEDDDMNKVAECFSYYL